MDRVVERPASPARTNRSSTNSSNSCHSRDFGKPRRSYYRLFPSVEPTPPASPVSLHHHQRASLRNSSACGSYRRRSSSEDNGRGARDAQVAPHLLANSSDSPPKDGRKGSIPELSILRTVQEDGHSDAASEVQGGVKEAEKLEKARAFSDRTHNGFDSARLGRSTELCNSSADGVLARPGFGSYDEQRRPHTANATVIGLGLEIPTASLDDNRPVSQGNPHGRSKPRPNLRINIVKRSDKAAAPVPPPKSAQHSREVSAGSSIDGSMHSPFLVQDRSAVREERVASVALKQSIVPLNGDLKVRELTVAPLSGRRRASNSTPSNQAAVHHTSEVVDVLHRPASPQLSSNSNVGRWAELPSLASRFNGRAATPEAFRRPATPEQYASHAVRPSTSQGPVASSARSFSPVDSVASSRAVTPSLTGQSALAAARANVAALNSAEAPTWNASFSEQNKTPISDAGSVSSRVPSHSGISDPVQTLAELSEQCEALHARHATLRVQRQQISSGIIASLKEHKPGPDYSNMLLNEQLSLAAVSSSIDICFAKLKSLECRKEDAIAILVAQATSTRPNASENYAFSSRKSSLAPSLNSGGRLSLGRSTPDLHSLYHSSRPGPIKAHSYRTEYETSRFRSPLYTQQSSIDQEPGTGSNLTYDNPAASIRQTKRLTQIPEPSTTPDSSYDTNGASSTADETDDSQTDTEDILEEFTRRPQKTDANGHSEKAVRVLGIGLDDPPVSPVSTRSNAAKKKARVPPLELQLDSESKGKADEVSPLTSSTLNADDPDQLARDLEVQLQSFPSAPVRPAPGPPPGHDVAVEESKRDRRHDSPVQRRDTTKSYASAHTINVYYDPGPHEDPLPSFP